MDKVYFLVRYIPFWAIPIFLMSLEFFYVAWMRKKKKWMFFCAMLSLLSLWLTTFYYWVGGPERAVHFLMNYM